MFLQKYNGKIISTSLGDNELTLWGRMMHVCVSKLTIIVSDKGLSPGRHQAIIWTNAGISLIGILRTNVSEILSEIDTFSFQKMHLKVSCTKWPLLRLSLNEFIMSRFYKMEHVVDKKRLGFQTSPPVWTIVWVITV